MKLKKVNTDKIKAENIKLKGAVKRRTIELEEKNRELEIEAALERVRARTMAMKKSEDLFETTLVLFQQFKSLGLTTAQVSICIFDEPVKMGEMFVTLKGAKIDRSFSMELDKESFVMKKAKKAFLSKKKSFSISFKGKELQTYNHWRNLLIGKKGWDESSAVRKQSWNVDAVFFSRGMMGISSDQQASNETIKILARFANVFDLAFTRFLDLQKAEAQTREARIEVSLERIRARTMAMQKSDELPETSFLLFEQLRALGETAAQLSIGIIKAEDGVVELSATLHGSQLLKALQIPIDEPFVMKKAVKAWKAKKKSLLIALEGKDLENYNNWRNSLLKKKLIFPEKQWNVHLTFFSKGLLSFSSDKKLSNVTLQLLERFAGVFDGTYTRFLDLQKAEAQAREAQIEASLEKVRASAMAMHNSNDISSTTNVVFAELRRLGIQSKRCGVALLSKNSQTGQIYAAATSADGDLHTLRQSIQMTQHPSQVKQYESWLAQENYVAVLSGEELRSYYQLPFFYSSASYVPPEHYNQKEFGYYFPFSEGLFYAWTEKPYSDNEVNILNRFKSIIDLTFRRYFDLQKAEAQVREAQIEAALEKVRASAMAMHKSEDLHGAVKIMFEEFQKLNLSVLRCGVGILNKDSMTGMAWATSVSDNGLAVQVSANENFDTHPLMRLIYECWQKQEDLAYILQGQDLIDYYRAMEAGGLNLPKSQSYFSENKLHPQYYYVAMFKAGGLYAFRNDPFAAEDITIMKRFASVVNLTYNRFLDLQKAEAQAREAQIEAALERVRSRTMGMQKSAELKEVIQVVYDQFVHLNIHVEHTGFVMDYKARDDYDIWIADNLGVPSHVTIPYFDSVYYNRFNDAKKTGQEFFATNLDFEEKNRFYQKIIEYVPGLPEETKKFLFSIPGLAASTVLLENVGLYIENFSGTPYIDEENQVLMRFGKVFQQTYTRFLDLQKAETQARESQIEASLERVRSKTMAMHNSQDVADTVATMFDELLKLGVDTHRCGIGILDESKPMEVWTARAIENGRMDLIIGLLDMNIHPLFKGALMGWLNKEESFSYELKGDDLIRYYEILNKQPDYPVKYDLSSLPQQLFHNDFYFPEGSLFIFSLNPLPAEAFKILKRFAAVFGQTYRRYLDLLKAEAQAREAQIEAALERVRSRAMAMHKTDELLDAAEVLYKEITGLGIASMAVTYSLMAEDKKHAIYYSINPVDGKIGPRPFEFPHTETEVMRAILSSWKKQDAVHLIELNEEETIRHQTYIGEIIQDYIIENKLDWQFSVEAFLSVSPKKAVIYTFNFKQGYIFMIGDARLANDQEQILLRFTKVFELTYRRFLDIRQAEAQAREAQIELSLERVRARAMAMHKSEELVSASDILFQEMKNLGIESLRAGIGIMDPINKAIEIWSRSELSGNQSENTILGSVPATGHPFWVGYYETWEQKKTSFIYGLVGDDVREFYEYNAEFLSYPERKGFNAQEFISAFYFPEGALNVIGSRPLTEEESNTMLRFARAFGLTFKRFLDLKNAEAQAREATIEAALEKVRGKAMAMHNSSDVLSTASMVFAEIRQLGIQSIRCGVGLLTKNNRYARMHAGTTSGNNDSLSLMGEVELSGHPCYDKQYEAFLTGKDYYDMLEGEELKSYYDVFRKKLSALPTEAGIIGKEYCYYLPFSEGILYSWSDRAYTDNEINILNRFKSIIDLTFRRYLELQQSESNARDAVKQAALDRVRADIASMRTKSDLDRITPLIWNELNILGIPFIRCGVFIMDEEQEVMHTFLSTPEGKAIAAFHLPYTIRPNINEVHRHWKNTESYVDHWDDQVMNDFSEILYKRGAVPSKEQYLASLPKDGFYLQFLPFLQGMLYVGSLQKLSVEEMSLIQSVADAFSTAYARYEDFNKLEAAKKQVDNTLTDLKQTQQQLVQSEKMASLGELTAGIAHEIQNPLNFVNNFSEVSNELIDEMNAEIEKGDLQEAKAIAGDIKQNLEKINHHGKRADAIVKGMLQHSRSSSGVKEPTDINALADEYLRLAYHGLRAKDKSFNAMMKTEFDESIGKINIIPQDIGRVILNLITNAFYAASTQAANFAPLPSQGGVQNPQIKHDPIVSLSTKKIGDKVFISVKDNGPGIPEKVLDKIFQPFFTTKPTGQGTGLGLSLSYDIVKAHGGEIKVETREGEGSMFVIILPQ